MKAPPRFLILCQGCFQTEFLEKNTGLLPSLKLTVSPLENQWLEDEIPFGAISAYFQVLLMLVSERKTGIKEEKRPQNYTWDAGLVINRSSYDSSRVFTPPPPHLLSIYKIPVSLAGKHVKQIFGHFSLRSTLIIHSKVLQKMVPRST